MKTPYILVFDLGSQNLRGIVFDIHGRVIASKSLPVTDYKDGSEVEQDTSEWKKNCEEIIADLLKENEVRKRLEAIGITGFAYGVVPISSSGEPLSRAITYYDARAVEQAEFLYRNKEFLDYKSKFRINPSPSHLLEKIIWIKNNQPGIYRVTDTFLDTIGFLYYQFTGEKNIDYYSALKLYSYQNECRHNIKLFRSIEIDENKLPRILKPLEHTAYLKPELMRKWLIDSLPVAYLTYDSICAMIGCGIIKHGQMNDNSGTGTSLKMLIPQRVSKEIRDARLVPNYFGKGDILSKYIRMTGKILTDYSVNILHDPSYDKLTKHLQQTHPNDKLIFLLDTVNGGGKLYSSDTLEELTIEKGSPEITRAVVEGSIYPLREYIELFKQYEIMEIIASGGVAKNKEILQIKADIFQMPLSIMSEVDTTALGAAILTATSTGIFSTLEDAVAAMAHREKTYEPRRKFKQLYDSLFQKYSTLKQRYER